MATSIGLAKFVDVGDDVGISVVVLDDAYHHLRVRFTFAHENGTLALDSIRVQRSDRHLHAAAISVAQLRAEFPWAAWDRAARAAAVELVQGPAGASGRPDPRAAGTTGAKGDDLLIRVAMEYREHLKAGHGNPSALIAEKYCVNPATARGWIHRARAVGLLGPAKGRTAGEVGIVGPIAPRSSPTSVRPANGNRTDAP